MIIDSILDRRNGYPYNAHEFYNDIRDYERLGVGTHGEDISIAITVMCSVRCVSTSSAMDTRQILRTT